MRVVTALVLSVLASSAIAQVRVVRTISVSLPPEMPDFDATFQVTKTFPLRIIRIAPPATPTPRPDNAERGRVMAFSSRLAAYCARPGKDENSWLRVKGRRFYCPG